jgi:hypothetical protein
VLIGGCALDVDTSTKSSEVESGNRLASNRLASNRLASNRLASNSLGAAALSSGSLIETEEGRDVFSYIVSCALPSGSSVTVQDSGGTPYTFGGLIGLAPAWATTTPTVSERRWVTACVLARTNYYGVPVDISMRGSAPALATTAEEEAAFPAAEGAFYGDLFDSEAQAWYACGATTTAIEPLRLCTISEDGTSTMCGFTYASLCSSACSASQGTWSGCAAGSGSYAEVITTYLQP